MKKKLLFLFLIISSSLPAQSGLDAEILYVYGFQAKTLHTWYTPVREYSANGYNAKIIYTYTPKNSKTDLQLGAGFKQLFISGISAEEKFTGFSTKFNIALGAEYKFDDAWSFGLGGSIENNRDFKDFRNQTTDNFRYNAYGDVQYYFGERISAVLRYIRGLYPLTDHYLLANPGNRIDVGINYKIFVR